MVELFANSEDPDPRILVFLRRKKNALLRLLESNMSLVMGKKACASSKGSGEPARPHKTYLVRSRKR